MSKTQQQIQKAFIEAEKQKIFGRKKNAEEYSRKEFYAELKKSRPDLAEAIKQRPQRKRFWARS